MLDLHSVALRPKMIELQRIHVNEVPQADALHPLFENRRIHQAPSQTQAQDVVLFSASKNPLGSDINGNLGAGRSSKVLF